MKNQKQIFILKNAEGKDQKFTVNEQGHYIPVIEVTEKKEVWEAVNSIADTCKILKLSRNTIMGLIQTGQLKAVKAGIKRWIITGQAIEEFLGQAN